MQTDSTEFKALMEQTGLIFEIDDDGDARVHFDMGDGRSQMAWVSQHTSEYQDHANRDVYSYIASLDDIPKRYEVLESLLAHAAQKKMGGIIILHNRLTYRVDADVAGGVDALKAAIYFAANVADELEKALTLKDKH